MTNDQRYRTWLTLSGDGVDTFESRKLFIDNLQAAGVRPGHSRSALHPVGKFDSQESLRDQIVYQMGPAFAGEYQRSSLVQTYVDVITSGRRPGEFIDVQELYSAAVGSAIERAQATDTIYGRFVHDAVSAPQGIVPTVGRLVHGVAADMSLHDVIRNDEFAPPSLRFSNSVSHAWDVIDVGLLAIDAGALALKVPTGLRMAASAGRTGFRATLATLDNLNVALKGRLSDLAASMFRPDGSPVLGKLSDQVAYQLARFLPPTPKGGVGELLGRNYDVRNGSTLIVPSGKAIEVTGRESLSKIGAQSGFDWSSFNGFGDDANLFLNDAKLNFSSDIRTATAFNVGNQRDNFGRSLKQLRQSIGSDAFIEKYGFATSQKLVSQIDSKTYTVRVFAPPRAKVVDDLMSSIRLSTGTQNVQLVRF